jgi:hypothetical protein
MKVLALAKSEEPEETDSETSWMGIRAIDDDMDEVKGKGWMSALVAKSEKTKQILLTRWCAIWE